MYSRWAYSGFLLLIFKKERKKCHLKSRFLFPFQGKIILLHFPCLLPRIFFPSIFWSTEGRHVSFLTHKEKYIRFFFFFFLYVSSIFLCTCIVPIIILVIHVKIKRNLYFLLELVCVSRDWITRRIGKDVDKKKNAKSSWKGLLFSISVQYVSVSLSVWTACFGP